MKVFVINGQPGVGKTTFAELCTKYVGNTCINISTVDFVKKVARWCGWNGQKTAENRKFLSDLKDLLTQWNDVPMNDIRKQIEEFRNFLIASGHNVETEGIVFVHCREPHEIKRLVDEFGAQTILVRRQSIESKNQSNHADSEVMDYPYDFTIWNDSDLKFLLSVAIDFLKENCNIDF